MASIGNASAPHKVFVYGSLMAEEVVRALLKRVPPSLPAVLSGYHRFKIKDRVYPAILPVETKKVTGKVLMGITDVELDILDTFEDVEYERRSVEVSLQECLFDTIKCGSSDKSEKLLVNAYVWSDKNDPNLYSEWDFEEWQRLHKKDFIAMTVGFMDDMEQPDSKTRVATYESYFQT